MAKPALTNKLSANGCNKLVNEDKLKEKEYEYHELRQCKELFTVDKVKLSLNDDETSDSESDIEKYDEF